MAKTKGEPTRIFLRTVQAGSYALDSVREQQLAASPIRRGRRQTLDFATSAGEGEHWIISPADDEFLTQTVQVHYVVIPPLQACGVIHGHQNEAAFYILEGNGYDIHDGKRYEWAEGDLLVVHSDSVHQHFNSSADRQSVAIVFKAKALWMYLGLIQQGRPGQWASGQEYGERHDWSVLWTPGATERSKLVHSADIPFHSITGGSQRNIAAHGDTLRFWSLDIEEVVIDPGSQSERRWRMADEVMYVLSGHGLSKRWDVHADIDDKYYARIAVEPTAYQFKASDAVFIPPNVVHQVVNQSDTEPLRMLIARNRIFSALGYGAGTVINDHEGPGSGAP